jgi:DNA invertase Pin-like site-specific DNA recombinase
MRVALYARVSTDDGDQNPETQLFRLRNVAKARDMTVSAEYVDQASGKTMHRPGLIRMMEDGKKGAFDAVMVMKIDRLNRKALDALFLLDDLGRSGIGLIISDEGIDTTTAWGRAIYGFIAIMAELERDSIGDRTKRGLDRVRAEGKTLGRPTAELSPYQKEKARRILEECPGMSQRELAGKFEGIGRTALIAGLKKEGII